MPRRYSLQDVLDGTDGDFIWGEPRKDEAERIDAWLYIYLPNGAGIRKLGCKVMPLETGGGNFPEGPVWAWDGDREKPTIRASIFPHDHEGNPKWHGWLTRGVLHGV